MRKSQNEYMRVYMNKRYHTDPQFRQKIIDATLTWQRNNKEHVNKKQNERYANRTPKEIEERKQYLKNLRMKNRKNGIIGYGNTKEKEGSLK